MPSLLSDLTSAAREAWESRELLWQLTRRDVTIRYKQSVMGVAWALLLPGLIVLSGILIRLAMGTVSGHAVQLSELGGVASKSVPWAFFTGAIGFGTGSLLSNSTLITRIYFPREVLPASAVLAQAFDSGIGALALMVALPQLGATLSPALLWVPLLVLLLIAFTLAATLFLSCANLFFRDVKYLVQVLLTFGIFLTPVFFEPALFGPRIGRLIMLNPLSAILEGFRLSIIEGRSLAVAHPAELWQPAWLLYSALWSLLGLLLAIRYFRRSAAKFAEYA
ncbi:MAG TPA: ABC transporter permease [Gemmatimonadales bacterium]|nr:ABC transporter permease [Gemmatimonadales bacterium]